MKTESIRFWSKVSSGNVSDCWTWRASKFRSGYGQFVLDDGTHITASRYAWMHNNGAIPDGMMVCHKCDNPACCNTSHMFLGTGKDNADDMDSKNRRNPAFGERNCRARLNKESVRAIRQAYDSGNYGYRKLSAEFGIDRVHAQKIITRKLWPHVN